jgi:glycerophosphoryl diester phosphodiesterase
MSQKLYSFFFDDLLKTSWRSVVLLWKPMAGWTLLVYLIFTALSAPLLVSLLDWTIFRGDRLFVGNEELYTWFFSPAGFLYLFSFILISLTGIIIRYAGIYQIATNDLLGRKVSLQQVSLQIVTRIHVLIKICALTILGFILILIPFLSGLGLIYLTFLTEFDLNYYWYTTPPEWYRALTYGGIWLGVWLISVLILTASLLPVLPAYLTGKKTLLHSFREVWQMPMPAIFRFLKIIGIVAGLWFFFRFVTDAILLAVFLTITDWAQSQFQSLRPLALLAGGYFFSSLIIGAVISFFGFSFVSVIITKYYYQFSKPGIIPAIPNFKRLTQKTLRVLTWWFRPARIALLIFIIAAGSITASVLIVTGPESDEDFLVIAHRANAMGAPENSIPALQNSIAIGADMAEIDVQLTADGTVVVLHDEDLMRVAGDPRQIAGISFEDLRELNLTSNRDFPNADLRVPALAEYLELSKDRITLMIELKYYGFNPELAEKTIELIREYGMEDQVVLKSLYFRAVEQIMELAPELTAGYVSAAALGDISRLPIQFLSVNHTNITPQLIQRARSQNMAVYAWTVNNRDDMISAILKGTDGIITDFPEISQALKDDIRELTGTERVLLQLGLLILEGQTVISGE